MSLKYTSTNQDTDKKEEGITVTAMSPVSPSTDSQPPSVDVESAPVVEPIAEPLPKEDKQDLKRTLPMPTTTESTSLNDAIDQLTTTWKNTQELSEKELEYLEKQQRAALWSEYSYMAMQISIAIFFIVIAISYLKMANVAKLKALKI